MLSVRAKGPRSPVIVFIAYSFTCDSFDRKLWKNSHSLSKESHNQNPAYSSWKAAAMLIHVFGQKVRGNFHFHLHVHVITHAAGGDIFIIESFRDWYQLLIVNTQLFNSQNSHTLKMFVEESKM